MKKISRKAFLRLLAAVMSIVLVIASVPFAVAEGDPKEELAVMAGLSYVAPEYRDNNSSAFLFDAKAAGLQYEQLDGILDSAFASVKKRVTEQGLKYLLVNGDLTYNGEYYNSVAVAQKLRELEKETGVNVIVCNGNKDIYNINASSFSNGQRKTETFTSPASFKSTFSDLGYDLAVSVHRSSVKTSANLSYAVELDGGYRLIVMDASYYDINGVNYGKGDTGIHGRFSDSLLAWVKTECAAAKEKGQIPIGMCHWSLSGASVAGSDFVLQNADEVANVLADAGMHYIYTAGSGKNDIAAVVSDNGNVIYDVQTASVMSFPNNYRYVQLDGEKSKFSLVEIDEALAVKSYKDVEYPVPYRVTSSLKIQYENYDIARYVANIVENYLATVLIPGVKKNGTLEGFVSRQYGFSLTEKITEAMGGGLNILNIIVIFDGNNVMKMLEDMYVQAQKNLLSDPKTISDAVYNRVHSLLNTSISKIPCTQFLETYGFGHNKNGGTLNDLLLSLIAYNFYGNEDSSEDKFMKDVIKNFKSGRLVTDIAYLAGEHLIEGLLFGDILSQIEMKPQYLIFLDDTPDSIGYYLQIAFQAFLALSGEDQSVTGAVNSVLKSGILKQYGKSISEVIDYFVGLYFADENAESIGVQLADILGSYVVDSDPQNLGDFNVTYDGSKTFGSYADKENFRLPTMTNVTLGDDPSTEVYVTWYTKSTVAATDIEIYEGEKAEFYGGHFVGVEGVTLSRKSDTVERSYNLLELGFMSFGKINLELKKHILKISGLKPGKTYSLRVGDSSKKWWSDTINVTTTGGSDKTTFIHISDTSGRYAKDYNMVNGILSCAGSSDFYPDLDFVLHTGNYVGNSDDINQWKLFFNTTEDNLLGKPIVPVAGSSDSIDSMNKAFTIAGVTGKEDMEAVYYSFDYNNIHFVVLDSSDMKDDGTLGDKQLEWLDADMKNSNAEWRIFAIHEPVYTNGEALSRDNQVKYMNAMATLMDKYSADLVLTDGDGVYYRTNGMKGGLITDEPRVSYQHVETGRYYKTLPYPEGTVYSSVGSAGVNSSDIHVIKNVGNTFNESGFSADPDFPMFSAIEVIGDVLYLTTYQVNLVTKRASLIDSISLSRSAGVKGDADGDGELTLKDARIVLRASIGLHLFTKEQKQMCDMNNDGIMNVADARIIMRKSIHLE